MPPPAAPRPLPRPAQKRIRLPRGAPARRGGGAGIRRARRPGICRAAGSSAAHAAGGAGPRPKPAPGTRWNGRRGGMFPAARACGSARMRQVPMRQTRLSAQPPFRNPGRGPAACRQSRACGARPARAGSAAGRAFLAPMRGGAGVGDQPRGIRGRAGFPGPAPPPPGSAGRGKRPAFRRPARGAFGARPPLSPLPRRPACATPPCSPRPTCRNPTPGPTTRPATPPATA